MPKNIGILQLKAELDETVDGFKAGLAVAGFAESEVTFDYRNVQENVPSLGQEADDLVSSGVDLIFACTTPAAKFAKEAADFYQTPVVFTPVYDPVAIGLVQGWSGSGNHLAGVSGKVDVLEKLTLMQTLVEGLKLVTVVYDPDDPNSVLEMEDLHKGAMDFGITVNERKVKDPAQLGRLDFPSDCQFVFATIGRMLEEHLGELAINCRQKGLPLCGHNRGAVEAGAACCVDSLPYNLGFQAGKIAARILEGQDPSGIPIERPEKTLVYLNRGVIQELGLDLTRVAGAEIIERR